MNVYTVEAHMDYEGFIILGIFGTKEKAEELLSEKRKLVFPNAYDSYKVNIFEIDKGE